MLVFFVLVFVGGSRPPLGFLCLVILSDQLHPVNLQRADFCCAGEAARALGGCEDVLRASTACLSFGQRAFQGLELTVVIYAIIRRSVIGHAN